MTPTARTLQRLRDDGWMAATVERFNHFANVRQDLFGIIDVIAVKGDVTLGVQATTIDNAAARADKLRGHPSTPVWLSSVSRSLEVWGWRKVAKTRRWEPAITHIAIP